MKFLWRFVQKIWERWFNRSAKIVYAEDLPEKLITDRFYVIGDPKKSMAASLHLPMWLPGDYTIKFTDRLSATLDVFD